MSEDSPGVLAKIPWPRPFVGLRGITLADVPREASAGITLAALMIPLNIGYAQVAGLPPVAGLYAAIIPLAVFALLTSSRHLVTSPDASIAGLVGAALVAFAAPGDPLRLQYALALAVICRFGVLRLLDLPAGVPRQLPVARRDGGLHHRSRDRGLHQPGAQDPRRAPRGRRGTGVLAAAERINGAMASSVETEGYFLELVALFDSIPRANLWSVAIGVSAFLIVRLMKRYTPKIPGALVALVLLTVIVAYFDLAAKGVGVLGAMPSGPPALTVAGHPSGRLPAAVAERPGDRGHSSLRRSAPGAKLQQQVRLQGGRRSDVVRLRCGQPGSRFHRLAGHRQQPVPFGGDGGLGAQKPAAQPGGGRDDRAGHAFLHRHAGVSAQCRPGRDRRQRGAVAHRGPRAPRAVADAPFGLLDRRRLPARRARRGSAARRPHRLSPVHHRCHPARVAPGDIDAAGSPRRQLFRSRGRRRGNQHFRPGHLSIRRPALLCQRDPLSRRDRATGHR